jgi:hypothetical protein
MAIQIVRRSMVLILFATLMTSCDTGGSTIPSAEPTVEPSASAPATESTGHESPAPKDHKPAITVAGAPAGDGGRDRNDDGSLCVYVQWLGDDDGAHLGGGIAFQVTEVHLRHARRGSFSCDGVPCQGFVFQPDSDVCSQAVLPGPTRGTLSLSGRVLCSAPQQECRHFRSNLILRTVSIPAAEPDTDDSTDTGGSSEPEPSAPGAQPSSAE